MSSDPLDLQVLEDALRHLYDPVELRRNPLTSLFAIPAGDEAPAALRHLLIEAIQSLKPPMRLSQASRAFRIYLVLAYRYIEQSTQKQVANELGLGIRQLRRLEVAALQTLAQTLEARRAASSQPGVPESEDEIALPGPGSPGAPGTDQELELLRKTSTSQVIPVLPFVEAILHTVAPLMASLNVNLVFMPQTVLPDVYGQVTPVRHGIINVLSAIGQSVSGGKIRLTCEPTPGAVRLLAAASPAPGQLLRDQEPLVEAVKLGQRLLALSGGSMALTFEVESQPGIQLNIRLPRSSPRVLLALDDNLDALRLFERYLYGSAYRFSGMQDAAQLIPTAESLRPDIILLDVMLAGYDGWELLGRLREHPLLGKTPVIVSTILPQEPLAMALGAAAFLKKPVSQEAFLGTLDRLLASSQAREWS